MKLCVLLKFSTLKINIHVNQKLYADLAKKFNKIYFVNISRLRFFSSFKNYKITKNEFLNNPRFEIVDIKNFKEFINFFKNSNFIAINNFGTSFKDFYLHYLIKKLSIKQILIQNIGFIPRGGEIIKQKILKKLSNFLKKTLPHKIYSILLLLKIFRPIDLRFVSNKILFDSILKYSTNSFMQTPELFIKVSGFIANTF